MAYQVNKFNGIQLTSVSDGTIDTSTDLTFIGKNYAGYGEVQNENFLHLLESFSNATQPPKPISGQLWYDTSTKKIKVYDDEKFKVVGGAEFGSAEPMNPGLGDLWFNSQTQQLHAWNGTSYQLVGPDLNTGQSAMASVPVTDVNGVSHTITKLSAGGKVILVLNKDAEFELNADIIPDFTVIKQGVTLASSSTGISLGDWIYWGTTSNSLKLGGTDAEYFMRRDNPTFNTLVKFKDPGFTVGDQEDLSVRVDANDQVILENRLGNPITFKVAESTATQGVLVIDKQVVKPGNGDIVDLGTNELKWGTVYSLAINTTAVNSTAVVASTFTGALTGNVTGSVTGNITGDVTGNITGDVTGNVTGNITGDVTGNVTGKLNTYQTAVPATANTIVVRDSNGAISVSGITGTVDTSNKIKVSDYGSEFYTTANIQGTANTVVVRDSHSIINGTATAARYADLAEKYLTDKEYEVGTVVTVGGNAEVTACEIGNHAIGVVSKNPAFMMNSGLVNGTYIALKGRVPVLTTGPVMKGDKLTAGPTGLAIPTKSPNNHIFAIALETNDTAGVKLIEAVVL